MNFSETDKLNVLRNLSQNVGKCIIDLQNPLLNNLNELCELLINEGLIIKGRNNLFFLTENGERYKQYMFNHTI